MGDGAASGVEQGAAYTGAAMTDALAPAGLAALPGARRQTDQRGDLFAGQPAQFGQLGDQGGGHHRADAEDRLQQPVQFGQ